MITTSLELSKRLKEAGFTQDISNEYGDEQSRWWCQWDGKAPRLLWLQSDGFNDDDTHGESGEINVLYKSFFAEEILEKLPSFILYKINGKYAIEVLEKKMEGYNKNTTFMNKSLADACANAYLHLKEHNLLPQ